MRKTNQPLGREEKQTSISSYDQTPSLSAPVDQRHDFQRKERGKKALSNLSICACHYKAASLALAARKS